MQQSRYEVPCVVRHCQSPIVRPLPQLVTMVRPARWRASVVSTSVFGRQTLPDLCLIHG